MREVLEKIAAAEAGKRFLINLADCLEKRHLPSTLVRDIMDTVARQVGADRVTWDEFFDEFLDTMFADPDAYQFLGPRSCDPEAEWITVRPLADIIHGLKATSGISDDELRSTLMLLDLDAPHIGLSDDQAKWIATALSDERNGFRFALAKRFPNPRSGAFRFAPSWYSRWANLFECARRFTTPSSELAGRIRDWLGLGHFLVDHPLYLLRCQSPVRPDAINGHRPTVFDGFDNKLYKHRSREEFEQEMSGSTIDIAKVRSAASTNSKDIEGGPEIVSTGIWFSPDHFTCTYIGKTPPLNLDLDCSYLHELMLPEGVSVNETVNMVTSALDRGRLTCPRIKSR